MNVASTRCKLRMIHWPTSENVDWWWIGCGSLMDSPTDSPSSRGNDLALPGELIENEAVKQKQLSQYD